MRIGALIVADSEASLLIASQLQRRTNSNPDATDVSNGHRVRWFDKRSMQVIITACLGGRLVLLSLIDRLEVFVVRSCGASPDRTLDHSQGFKFKGA